MRTLMLLLCGMLLALPVRAGVERVEPGNWWVGMRHDRVQLMVHGPGIATASARIDRPGVRVLDVARGDSPNYLFVTVHVQPDAAPGAVPIEFLQGGKTLATHTWRIDARAPGSAQRRGFDARDAIYLITPDRFANGDPSNDSLPGLRERANRGSPGGRHGGDLAGIRQHLDYIAGMGFTQLWPTPFLENDQPEYSYHGYAITDLYKTDPRMGRNEDVQALSREARAKGIGLVMDIVLNHIGSKHWWMADLPERDWINNGGRFAPTSHRRTTVQDPYAAPADRAAFTDGWFVDAMPDLNQRNPRLARYLIQNTLWWIEYAGLSGIREDTFGYADADFLSAWAKAVQDEYPGFSIVGEEWSANPAIVAHWQRGRRNASGHVPHVSSMMDFPLHIALRNALAQPEGWETGWVGLYEMLANDVLYPDPARLVTFAENHDTPRLLAHLDGDLGLWQVGMAYLATMRGIPQFYYGSEVLLRGPKERDDGRLRADMPGGWAGDAASAFTGDGLDASQRAAQDYIRALFNWRKRTPVLHSGALMHFVPHDGVYAYVRHQPGHAVLVLLNKQDAPKTVELQRFDAFLQGRRARLALSGKPIALGRTLEVPAKSATLLEIN
jgi:glycosidase